MKKVGAEQNWGDLETKTLDGWRITQLIGMMPMRRGLVVASLLASAMAHGPEEKEAMNPAMFLLYMLVLHILAMVGFWSTMSSGRRRFRSIESQTYLHTGDQGTQTAEVQRSEPSAGSTAKATGAPNRISTVGTAAAASAPSGSSSVAIASAPASVVEPIPAGSIDWVWIIGNGVRYHRAGCGMVRVQLRRTRHLVRAEAIRRGHAPGLNKAAMRPTGHNAVKGCKEYNPIHEPMIACVQLLKWLHLQPLFFCVLTYI